VVRGLFRGAQLLVDFDAFQPVGGLRREQQMVDAQTVVLLPGARLIIPEGVLSGGVRDRAQRLRIAGVQQLTEFGAGLRQEQRVSGPAFGS